MLLQILLIKAYSAASIYDPTGRNPTFFKSILTQMFSNHHIRAYTTKCCFREARHVCVDVSLEITIRYVKI